MTTKVVRDNLHSQKCTKRSFAEPVGDCMESSNSIYISSIKVGQRFSWKWAPYTSCILYFFLASRRHLSIDPKCPNTDPRPKLAKALRRIVIVLNPRCSMCDNFPILEKIRRPKISSDRERTVVKHLPEREIMFRPNCSQLLNDIGNWGDFSGFDAKGLSGFSYGGEWWVSGRDDDILKRKAYTIGGAVESARVKGIKKTGFGDSKYEYSYGHIYWTCTII